MTSIFHESGSSEEIIEDSLSMSLTCPQEDSLSEDDTDQVINRSRSKIHANFDATGIKDEDDNDADQDDKFIDEKFLPRYAQSIENEAVSMYSVLSQNHKITQYLYDLFGRFEPDDEDVVIYVMANRHDTNAFVLPNGSIFISQGMIEFCEYEEELIFVLAHEYNHFKEGHTKKSIEARNENRNRSVLDSYLINSGIGRYHESESDVKGGMLEMEKKGLNAYGGISYFKKLVEQNRFLSSVSSSTHGSDVDRMINMTWVTNIIDLKHTSTKLTPISSEIKSEIMYAEKWAESFNDRNQLGRLSQRYTDNASLQQLLIIYKKFIALGGNLKYANPTEKEMYEMEFSAAYKRLIQLITNKIKCSSKQDKIFVSGIVQELVASASDSSYKMDFLKKYLNCIKNLKEAEDLINLLDPGLFEKLEVFCEADPSHFAQGLTQHLIANGLFKNNGKFSINPYFEFVVRLSKKIQSLYSEAGLFEVDLNEIWYSRFIKDAYDEIRSGADNGIMIEELFKSISEKDIPYSREAIEKSEDKGAKNGNADKTENGDANGNGGVFKFLNHYKKSHNLSEKTVCFIENIFNGNYSEEEIQKWVGSKSANVFKAEMKELCSITSEIDTVINEETIVNKSNHNIQHLYTFRKNYEIFYGMVFHILINKKAFKNAYEQAEYIFSTGFDLGYNDSFMAIIEHFRQNNDLVETVHSWGDDDTDDDFDDGGEDYHYMFRIKTIKEAIAIYNAFLKKDMSLAGRFHEIIVWWSFNIARLLTESIKKGMSKQQFIKSVDLLSAETKIDFASYISDHITDYDRLLFNVFEAYSLNLEDPEDARLLLNLSFFVSDTFLSMQLQKNALDSLSEKLSFEDEFALVFSRLGKRIYSTEILKRLSEEKAVSHSQICQVRDKLLSLVDFENIDFKSLGIATHIDESGNVVGQKFSALKDFLTFESDIDLRGRFVSWEIEDPNTNFRKLFFTDTPMKYALLRKFLTGRNGVLIMPSYRTGMVNYFLEKYIEKPETAAEEKLLGFLNELLIQFASRAELEDLYFTIFPLLLKRFLAPPQHQSTWEEAVWHDIETGKVIWANDLRDEYFSEHEDELIIEEYEKRTGKVADDIEDIRPKQRYKLSESYEKWFEYKRVPKICGTVQEKLNEMEIDTELNDLSLNTADKILDLMKDRIKSASIEKTRPLDFILEIAKNLGSPGIRFLQLLGQYINLPPEFSGKFNEIYDQVFGQIKVIAYDSIKREWPEFEGEIVEMRAPVGGGSLMTVYEVITKDGERQVLKVLNPNAGMKTERIYKVLYEVFEAMGEEYQIALPIIDEIKEWINKDINFEGFLMNDKSFRENNHGFNLGDGYSINIPVSYAPENKFFKREEYVDGLNLTHLDELRENGHDIKAIVRLIAANFLQQITQGLVHSDVHPGNFRVTNTNEVAILDRNFFLEFSEDERLQLMNIFNSMNSVEDFARWSVTVLSQGQDKDETEHLIQNLTEDLKLIPEGDYMGLLKQSIAFIKSQGVKIPVKYTLLVKNIMGLDHLAKKAGFQGVMEVLLA